MSKYDDLMNEQESPPTIKEKARLGGFDSVADAYRSLAPDLTYNQFRNRINSGMSILEAGTAPRSKRGRPRLDKIVD